MLQSALLALPPHLRAGASGPRLGTAAEKLGELLLDYTGVRCGTCSGTLRRLPTAWVVLEATNRWPGNGDTGRFWGQLVTLAREQGRDLLVLDVGNWERRHYLMQRWGMQAVANTPHLLLPVAGPGECPAAYQRPLPVPAARPRVASSGTRLRQAA